MSIKFHCPHCQASIKAPTNFLGKTLPCPKCGQPVVVAEDSAPEVPPPLASEPEPVVDEVPQIVPHQPSKRSANTPPPIDSTSAEASATPTAAVPPPIAVPPIAEAAVPATNGASAVALESATPASGHSPSGELENVRIVDIQLPFMTVFRFAVQFFLANLLLGMGLGLIVMLFVTLLAAIGVTLL